MFRNCRYCIAFAAALAFATPVLAQGTAEMSTRSVSLLAVVAPAVHTTPEPLFASNIAVAEAANPFLAIPVAMRRSQSVALMIVGGAGLVAGSLINGDTGTIIMAGGAVAGLIGLFHYLR